MGRDKAVGQTEIVTIEGRKGPHILSVQADKKDATQETRYWIDSHTNEQEVTQGKKGRVFHLSTFCIVLPISKKGTLKQGSFCLNSILALPC